MVCLACLEKAVQMEVEGEVDPLLQRIHALRVISAAQEEQAENAIQEVVETLERERYLHMQSVARLEAQLEMVETEKNERIAELQNMLRR